MKSVLVALLLASAALAETPVTTVILVRHAERVEADGDVDLVDAGRARAQELARVLADVKIDRVYVTQYKRTTQTAQPLIDATKLEPLRVETGEAYARTVAANIAEKHRGETVLVVGHNTTTVDMLHALGIKYDRKIEHAEYDNLFVVTIADGKAKLLALKYGVR
ncbi:MAG TPA: phosphoglycerate mutase family protein [Thermoanaerobaculia bacterium]|nr:phosphoglycerate mutase family protein [Thermoanaerobaculia bacterium]